MLINQPHSSFLFCHLISIIIMLIHKNQNCLNLPFFKRENQQNEVDETSPLHKYTLLSIAKINTNGLDIYNNHFLSPFREEYITLEKRARKFELKAQHVSRFFNTFVKIFAIKHTIQPKIKLTMMIDQFLINLFEDIFEERPEEQKGLIIYQEKRLLRDKRREEVKRLREYFKPIINQFFQAQEKNMESTYEKQVEHAKSLIKKEMESILSEIDKHYQEIIKSEVLPNLPSLAQAKRYIKQNFQKIDSIASFKALNKKDVFKSFVNVNRPYIKIKVPCFIETFGYNQKENTIILPRYSEELQPVLTKLIDYVPRIHKADGNKEKLSLILLEKMKQLIGFFRQYQRKTSRVYPTTNLNDIYYDQKSMKIMVSYHPLIYDALGMRGSSKSVELRLATEPTPSFNFQTCHLELDEDIRWKLKKKYYYPKDSKENQLNQNDESAEKQTQDLLKLQENIHVWRIINKLYFMSRNSNMTNDLYQMYYCKITGKQKSSLPKPFKIEKYKDVTERIYEDIGANPEMLMQLIPQLSLNAFKMKKHDEYKHRTKQEQLAQLENFICLRGAMNPLQKFQFTLSQLSNFFQQDDDSLFQTLKLTSFKSQFYYRLQLIKQINLVFDSKVIFKRMLNIKKYLIMYFVSILEKAYFLMTVRSLQQRKANTREEIENELEKVYKNVCFNSQFQRRRNGLQMSIIKIKNYMERKDYNCDFLKRNQHYYDDVLAVHYAMKMIAFQEDVCRMLERNLSKDLETDIAALLQKQQVQMSQEEKQPFSIFFGKLKLTEDQSRDISELKSTLQTRISSRIKEMHEKASFSIKKLTQKDVEPYVDSAQIFQKAVDFPSKAAEQVCLFYNFKLLTFLRMYVTSNKNNWRKYERMYTNTLIGGKTITFRSPVQQIKDLEKDELMMLVQKMKIIIRSISDNR